MDSDSSGNALLVGIAGGLVTVLFVWVGLAMAHDPPAPADAAVGKGLLALAGATAIVTVSLATYFDMVDKLKAERARAAKAVSKPSHMDADGL